jgi:hypothetical protein
MQNYTKMQTDAVRTKSKGKYILLKFQGIKKEKPHKITHQNTFFVKLYIELNLIKFGYFLYKFLYFSYKKASLLHL